MRLLCGWSPSDDAVWLVFGHFELRNLSYSSNGDYYFVNGNNLVSGKIVITRDTKKSGVSEYKKYRKNLNNTTILLSINGTIGNLAFYSGEQIILGKSAAYLNIKTLISKRYIYFILQIERISRYFEEGLTGTTIKNLGLGTIRKTPIAIPKKREEQRAIATALSDVDALITVLDKLIAKKRALKTAVMQQLLTGKQRLPGFGGEWEVKQLGDMGATYGGLASKNKNDFGHGEARYITFMNIMGNVVIDSTTFERVDVKPGENQNEVKKGDLFFNGSSETPEEVRLCAVLAEDVENVCLNSFCFGFRLHELAPANGLYLVYFFRSQEGRELLWSLAQGATRYNLSKRALMNVSFPIPPLPEQTAIAQVLSDMDAEIAALEARRDKTHAIKQGMIQELLMGRTRLLGSDETRDNRVCEEGGRCG
jgi:type I restriction enzyme S subunit